MSSDLRDLGKASHPTPSLWTGWGRCGSGWRSIFWTSGRGRWTRRGRCSLDDWRDLYEIISNPVRRSDLAALVIARLREIGQSSSLFGVAASVGTVLGYENPTQLELLEYSASVARSALNYIFRYLPRCDSRSG